MRKKRIWHIPKMIPSRSGALARELKIPLPLAQVLLNRGLTSPDQIRIFLEGGLDQLGDPLEIPGMKAGAERVLHALREGEAILVYGDYDVDGITGTALLTSFLRRQGGQVSYYIPDRLGDGYGLNSQALLQAKEEGIQLVITVDCGVSALREAVCAKEAGLDLVITDHHQIPQELPQAIAVIDPKTADGDQPWSGLAGVGVAFKLAQAVCNIQGIEFDFRDLDFVALGTVADIVPLTGENRILVKEGIRQLAKTRRPGLLALMEVSGIRPDTITTEQIGYTLAPRLNACGRLSRADLGVELLLTGEPEKAGDLARILDKENQNRQALETEITAQALSLLEKEYDPAEDRIIILASRDWHPGVIGIVASRLVEKFYRPTILISLEEGIGKGSARSIPGFNLYRALEYVQDHLVSFGGHEMAAGLTIREEMLPALRRALKNYARQGIREKDLTPFIDLDYEIPPHEINYELVKGLEKLAPFGFSNPAPLFVLRNRVIAGWREVGSKGSHLKLRVQKDGQNWLEGIAFQKGSWHEMAAAWERCDLAFIPELNTWNGRTNIQLKIKDLKPANEPDDPFQPLSFLERVYQEGEIWLEDDYFRDIAGREEFFTKIVGVTFENRQQLLSQVTDGDGVELRREKDNPNDPFAVAVFWQGQQLGYLKARLARNLAPAMDKGLQYTAYITQITGRDKDTLGANLCVQRLDSVTGAVDFAEIRENLGQLPPAELRDAIRRAILGKYSYHDKQREAITALLSGESSLVILATGRGKSAIFQSVAAELALTRSKVTVIIYPLRSLVNDQFQQLREKLAPLGINVAAVNGSMSLEEKKEFFKRLLAGQGDIILTTPEFLEFHLEKFKAIAQRIGLLVVDECHHLARGKRRGYRTLPHNWRQLGKPLVLAATATADEEAVGLIRAGLACDRLIIEEYTRANLILVNRREEKEKLVYLLELIAGGDRIVIYVNSRRQSYQLASELRSYYPQGRDEIGFYHGGLNSQDRITLEGMFRKGDLRVMVTTSAFGEGINIPDIKHVVLYHLCFSATEFNQLAGRAGRDNQKAYVHILFGQRDRKLNEFILEGVTPSREVLAKVYLYLRELSQEENPLSVTNTEIQEAMQRQGLKNFREQTASTCLAIFEELGLLLREVEGNRRYIHFYTPPPGKMALTDSIRYLEGLSEWEEFQDFADYVLRESENMILAAFNKPIYPKNSI